MTGSPSEKLAVPSAQVGVWPSQKLRWMDGTNGQVNARLLHALDRLHGEPRAMERRRGDRRSLMMPWPPEQERRVADRRAAERRTTP